MFEHLSNLKSFFVEVCETEIPHYYQLFVRKTFIYNMFSILSPIMVQGISDKVPLVKVVVPKNQSHSFITQGSPDTMVSFGAYSSVPPGFPRLFV